jgi:hypothetical protein
MCMSRAHVGSSLTQKRLEGRELLFIGQMVVEACNEV